jgi:di/tricarboxylate transporter
MGSWIVSLSNGSPLVFFILLYCVCGFVTNFVNNYTVAALFFATAMGSCEQMGMTPKPVAGMIVWGASAAFMAPIGVGEKMLFTSKVQSGFNNYIQKSLV